MVSLVPDFLIISTAFEILFYELALFHLKIIERFPDKHCYFKCNHGLDHYIHLTRLQSFHSNVTSQHTKHDFHSKQ
jgi:hypothetical protein